jgi:hypothetical protein
MRKFADMIRDYNYTVHNLGTIFENEGHSSFCIAMFHCVLTPYIYGYDNEIISQNFTQTLLVYYLITLVGFGD